MARTMPESLRGDAIAGFLVFLIALPLCLGIALASGFPPVAGVLSAIVGGLLTSHLGSAKLTIKGPAAGLIVIALGAVNELGAGDPVVGYKRALAVGVVAAAVQIVLALVRAGAIAAVMPPAVVHGMLAAIGVIIIAKQVPVAVGVLGAKGEPLEMLLEIPHYLSEANPSVLAIGVLSLVLLVAWPRLKNRVTELVPAPMVVLLVAIPLASLLGLATPGGTELLGLAGASGPEFLVSLPGNLLDAVTLPDFSAITSAVSVKYIVMFALVGSIESLLSVIAVDSMDPAKEPSNLNRDLLVTGIGNLVSALIGGLPMISEIVRSKANVDAGAKSPWANFFHGGYLLLFVALLPGVLQMIPLAALAAMLVVTGARLAAPQEFRHVWHIGKDQFALFFTTFAVTLATDLLVGVAAGIILKVALHIARGAPIGGLIKSPVTIRRADRLLQVDVVGPAAFTNLLALQRAIEAELDETVECVRVDLSLAPVVDHTVQEKLKLMADEWPGATLQIVGLDGHTASSSHDSAFRRRSA